MEAKAFTAAQLSNVQGFDCGDAVWEVPLNQWIVSDEAVANTRRNQIWLYYEGTNLIGYGCLGETKRPHPTGDDPKIKLAIIPYVAIQKAHQGHPPGVGRDQKYSGQIMNHL